MNPSPNNRRSPLVAGTQIPSASEAEFGDLISKASFVPLVHGSNHEREALKCPTNPVNGPSK